MNKKSMAIACVAALAVTPAFATFKTAGLCFTGYQAGRPTDMKVDGKKYRLEACSICFNIKEGQGPLAPYNNTVQKFFCAEVCQPVNTNKNQCETYKIVAIRDLSVLQGAQYRDQKADAVCKLMNMTTSNSKNAFQTHNMDYAQAFQLMTWELLYDFNGNFNSIDLNNGRYKGLSIPNAAVAAFNSIKLDLQNWNKACDPTKVVALTNSSKQDVIFAVPEPSTIFAVAAGVAILARRRRK